MKRDTVTFQATVKHPDQGEVYLHLSVPVEQCHEHKYPDPVTGPVDLDEKPLPNIPHVISTNGYHQDYAVCLGMQP